MPKPRTAEVVIYTGDYLDRIRHIERQHEAAASALEAAQETGSESARRVGQAPETSGLKAKADALAEQHDALVAEAEEAAIRVRVTTVRRRKYRELSDANPPREGDKGDQALGVNALTFREVMVPEAIVEVTEDGTTRPWSEFTADERDDFLDTLAESDFERIFGQAFGLVNGFAATPKALSSQTTSPSDET